LASYPLGVPVCRICKEEHPGRYFVQIDEEIWRYYLLIK
jgi:hypothetical protein